MEIHILIQKGRDYEKLTLLSSVTAVMMVIANSNLEAFEYYTGIKRPIKYAADTKSVIRVFINLFSRIPYKHVSENDEHPIIFPKEEAFKLSFPTKIATDLGLDSVSSPPLRHNTVAVTDALIFHISL